jgi:very-short-patch-repair endonuclease
LQQRGAEWKFRRQHPIGEHVVGFACPSRKLAVESDGGQHSEAAVSDASRTQRLETHGYRVIRFWNHEVLGNTEGVVQAILRELQKRSASPARLARTLSTPKGWRGFNFALMKELILSLPQGGEGG